MGMRDEILEQPAVAARVLERARPTVEVVAAEVRRRRPPFAVIAARGTSDHAAIYAQYALGVRCGLPVALAAPSIVSLYRATPRYADGLIIGVSQSGASPDVVGVVELGRAEGAITVAVTNDPRSPLAVAAEHVIDLAAGPERAVAATKTYTAELTALAMLTAAIRDGNTGEEAGLAGIPQALATASATEPDVARIAADQVAVDRCIVLGRGFQYATAREWALKLKELAYVLADPYSAADFLHGPLALVNPEIPVLAVAPSGATAQDGSALLTRLRDGHGARLVVISDVAELRALGTWAVALPAGLPEWLLPIVAIVPGQLHAYHLTRAKGLDPETPRHLRKVTMTR
jgi:glucosamine--fructose-6-phosphate aminotransferase (isomerizing)